MIFLTLQVVLRQLRIIYANELICAASNINWNDYSSHESFIHFFNERWVFLTIFLHHVKYCSQSKSTFVCMKVNTKYMTSLPKSYEISLKSKLECKMIYLKGIYKQGRLFIFSILMARLCSEILHTCKLIYCPSLGVPAHSKYYFWTNFRVYIFPCNV